MEMYFFVLVTLIVIPTNSVHANSPDLVTLHHRREIRSQVFSSSSEEDSEDEHSQTTITSSPYANNEILQPNCTDPDSKTCTLLPGEECSSINLCARNSFCARTTPITTTRKTYLSWQRRTFGQSLQPINTANEGNTFGRCKCKSGFDVSTNTTSRICLAIYGMHCNSTFGPCQENLKCAEGFCGCANPAQEKYDTEANRCLTYLGGHCGHSSSQICMVNAHCNNSGVCDCNPGFSSTPSLECLLDIGQRCENYDAHMYPESPNSKLCNLHRGLSCVGGRCECANSIEEYDKETQSCSLRTEDQTLLEMRHNESQMQSSASNKLRIFFPTFLNYFLLHSFNK